jgi:exosortase C (VPDSG-CTERM-specific)
VSQPTPAKAVEAGKLETVTSSIAAHALSLVQRRDLPATHRWRVGGYLLFIGLCVGVFLVPLAGLMRHARQVELHSHIPLVPFVVAYLLYLERGARPAVHRTALPGALLLGAVALGASLAALRWRATLSENDYLALMALSFVSVVAAGGFLFLGAKWMARAAFPLSFLVFMIPLPDRLTSALEALSVLGSAEVSGALLRLTGTPVVRDGTVFALPGIVLQVAQECSGIRSSWVLFITSLIASRLFLGSPWRRLILVAFVVPLGIVRNGFRILVIGLLCVHVGPHMIDSPIHHQGGPLFFAISLMPLFLFLSWLRRTDQ